MNAKQKEELQKALDILMVVVEEEEEKLSNMEEKFSETQRYQDMEEKKDELDGIKQELEDFIMSD